MLAPRGEGFAALAHKAGLNGQLMPAFAAALAALKTYAGGPGDGLKLPLVETVIDECERRRDPALAKVMALLWRFAAEAVKSEAAGFARDAIAATRRGRLPRSLDFSPANDDIAEPISGDAFDRPRLGPAQLELIAATSNPAGDVAPRVELPLARHRRCPRRGMRAGVVKRRTLRWAARAWLRAPAPSPAAALKPPARRARRGGRRK